MRVSKDSNHYIGTVYMLPWGVNADVRFDVLCYIY